MPGFIAGDGSYLFRSKPQWLASEGLGASKSVLAALKLIPRVRPHIEPSSSAKGDDPVFVADSWKRLSR
jgi:hypothetical protein